MKSIKSKLSSKTNPTNSLDTELLRPSFATLLANIMTPDGKQKYGMYQNKPVIFIDVKKVLNEESDKFQDKLLCDGLTMNAGDACCFSCTFCYVPAAMIKLHSERLAEFNRETGLNLDLSQVVIRRRGFLEVLKKQLLHPDGSRIYSDPNDHSVLYSSTLVDVAGNMELLRETAAGCLLVFENTEWQIRLLSKSSLLALLVTKNLIPEQYHHRLILGFSTGTLDDDLAAAIERGTGKVSLRIKALHELQDRGIRTFGMICPSLPYGTQEEYDEFSRAMCAALRVERCEHVWAEVINLRGDSLTATADALREAGYAAEAQRLEAVSGPGMKDKWEEYARMTFEAHQKHVAADKLRFLQYITKDTAGCWSCMRNSGAVLLGSHAEDNNLITIATSAPTETLPELEDDDIRYREERERIVTHAVNQSLAAAKSLYEIKTYRDGLLWRKDYRTFADYCSSRWGYEKSHAYRHVQAGNLLAKLDDSHSPLGENSGIAMSHLRPVCEMVPEDLQVACWKEVFGRIPDGGKLTATYVKKETARFLKKKGVETKKKPKAGKPDERSAARASVKRLEVDLGKLLPEARYRQVLEQILLMIDEEPGDGKSPERSSEEVIACDRMHEKDPASSAHDRVSSGRDEQAEGEAIPAEKVVITAEIVTAAMVDSAPTHERNTGTATDKPKKKTSANRARLSATEAQDDTDSPGAMNEASMTDFVSAPRFYEALYGDTDYETWLAETARSHPDDIRTPNDGGVARISFVRAKNFAHNSKAGTSYAIYKLLDEAEKSQDANPGAVADALFQQHALAANHSSS